MKVVCENFHWNRWATQKYPEGTGWTPSKLLRTFSELGAVELDALKDVPQHPQWHEEGCARTHTYMVCDAMAVLLSRRDDSAEQRGVLMLAALAHDFGKATTTVQKEKDGVLRWVSPGHDIAGVPIAKRFLERIQAKADVSEKVLCLVAKHMLHVRPSFSMKSVRKVLRELPPATFDELLLLMEADCRGRIPSSGLPDRVLNELIPNVRALTT